jgi:hypothetical protein
VTSRVVAHDEQDSRGTDDVFVDSIPESTHVRAIGLATHVSCHFTAAKVTDQQSLDRLI